MPNVALAGRPGLTLGSYPQRTPPREKPFERWATRRLAAFRDRRRMTRTELDAAVACILEAGESLERMPDELLAMSIAGLRVRFALNPDDPELKHQVFATIREVAGRTLGMRHFPSQIMGGWVLYHGMLAEMQTGEGKTLTATLAAGAAGLAGMPVHVITTNDYLASRDAEIMTPVYAALELSVGVVTDESDSEARAAAYRCDITYASNKAVAFDYLRDRVAMGSRSTPAHLKLQRLTAKDGQRGGLLMRGLCFAIVDEADSVLVDEARTPLILSRPAPGSCGFDTYRDALSLAGSLNQDLDFAIETRERRAILTAEGKQKLSGLATTMAPIWSATRRREELVIQALAAQHLYLRDRHYVVHSGKVSIVDASTGRLMPDRSWERGLHQMVEVKEGCEISDDKETLARLSYQRFFARYLKLGGMSGTTHGIESELATTYGLTVVSIPTHKPSRRRALPPRTFVRAADRDRAVVESVVAQLDAGRPVLVGTRTVESSEQLGQLLLERGLPVAILNARHAATEADIVAEAGQPGRVTVATNIAGRGTDIHLGEGVDDAGGLHVIVVERNEAERVDRQLIGRCARQGDAGSFQVFSSLDDEIPMLLLNRLFRAIVRIVSGGRAELPQRLGDRLMNRAQRALERRHRQARRTLEREDERMGDLLAFSGGGE